MIKILKRHAVTICIIIFSLSGVLFGQTELKSNNELSKTGYFQLKWKSSEQGVFVLQQDTTVQFSSPKTIYTGVDTARTVSGLLNGKYYYRIRSDSGAWSKPILVTVEHYQLSTALIFLGLGALVFIATAILIIRGHLAHRKEFGDANG